MESLAGQEADIAVRFMPTGLTPDPELHGRRAANALTAVYRHGDCWFGQRGAPTDQAWVDHTPWPDLPIRGAIIDVELQRRACAAGLGMAYLPCFLADGHLPRGVVAAPAAGAAGRTDSPESRGPADPLGGCGARVLALRPTS